VGVVFLDVAGDAVNIFEQEGKQRELVGPGERGIHGVELGNVVRAVVGWECDAGECDLDASLLEFYNHGIHVGLRGLNGQAAKAVVPAEFEDDDLRVKRDDVLDAFAAVFGGVATDAGVDDPVGVAVGVKKLLQIVWVGLAGVGAVARGEAVAEANDDGTLVCCRAASGLRGNLRAGGDVLFACVGFAALDERQSGHNDGADTNNR